MAQIESQALYKKIEHGKWDPIYFLYGEESYLLEQAMQAIKEKALEGIVADFNYNLFYASDCDVSQVRDAVETLPMMAPHRLVILKQAHQLSEKEWTELEALFEQPVESTIFLLSAEKVDKRKKAIKKLIENGTSVEFKRPFENQIPDWIKTIARSRGVQLTDEAIEFMHRMVGGQLRDIDTETQKLIQYLGDKNTADIKDVANVISRSREDSIFEFTESLARKDRISALYSLVKLLDQGQSEVGVVVLVARHLRILMAIHHGLKSGLSGARLAQFSGAPQFYLHKYMEQSRAWTMKSLEEALLVLADTDKALKSSPLSSHIWLENMILKLC